MPAWFKFTGGPVRENEFYVERREDREVWDLATNLDYAHLIAPRQTGKTSLLHRLRRNLLVRGFGCAYIDLSELDPIRPDAWYAGLEQRLANQLSPAPTTHISGPNDLKPYLAQFFASTSNTTPFIIILDEIGSIVPLSSAQSFFYALRSMYGEPADYPILRNVTLVLSGTIDPDTIVADSGASPFNYGERLYLPDFTAAQTRQITDRLALVELKISESTHEHIFTCTGGQPYLTQKICALLERSCTGIGQTVVEPVNIDRIIADHLLDPLKRESYVAHLRRVLRARRDMAVVIQQLLVGEEVSCEHPLAYEMYLLGLVHRANNGCLMLSNGICKAVAGTDGPSVDPGQDGTPSRRPRSEDVAKRHVRQQLVELQGRYEMWSSRIAALDTDIGCETDSERRLMLQERRKGLDAERDQMAEEMAQIERRIST